MIPRNETYRRIADVVLLRYATYCRGVKNIEAMRVRRRSVQWVVKLVGDMYDQIAAYRAVKVCFPFCGLRWWWWWFCGFAVV